MKDVGVLAAGRPDRRRLRLRAATAEADRADRHPRVQRGQRLRHRRDRAARRDHGGEGGRGRLRHGRRRREAVRGGPARRLGPEEARATPGRRTAASARSPRWTAGSAPRRCPASSPRSAWSTARSTAASSFELFARIAEKNHAHSTLNPLAAYTKRLTLDQIMNDVMIAYPNTRPMCSANCDGAAAAIVVSDSKLKTLSLEQRRRAVKISASVLTSDPWQEACQVLPDVNTLTRQAAGAGLRAGGRRPRGPRPRRAARLLRDR